MKVLDIIAENQRSEALEFIFKRLSRDAAKQAFAESTIEKVAADIVKKFTIPALEDKTKKATLDDIREAVSKEVSRSKYKDDPAFSEEIVKEVTRYHDKDLLPALRKARASKAADDSLGTPAAVKKSAALARVKWAALGAVGLLNKAFTVYAAIDITKSVQLYWERIDWALQRLELGEDGKDADGDPGISLATFELYHKEQLGVLFLSIATVHPALFTKIPIFGWLAAPFRAFGTAGTGLWMYFTNAKPDKFGVLPLPGQEPDENLREVIARYSVWQIKDIPWLPGNSGKSLASLLGEPIKWTEEFVKDLWTAVVTRVYPGDTIPEILKPTVLPDHASRKNSPAKQGANVMPGDADQNSAITAATKPPYAKGDAYYHKDDWEDMGNGYERHKFKGTVAKKLPAPDAAKPEVKNPADWRDMGNGYEVNIKTKPNGERIPFETGTVRLK